MKYILTILTILLITQFSSLGQQNFDWAKIDRDLIDSVLSLIQKSDPKSMDAFFKKHYERDKRVLGFGWTKSTRNAGGGDIQISADFFYYKGAIKTYIIHAALKREKEGQEVYKPLIQQFLPNKESEQGMYYKRYFYNYQIENILKPLAEFKKSASPGMLNAIKEYMSPTSGLHYGYKGFGGKILENRKFFNEIKDSLTSDQVLIMMYAINPVSRLTAIEYYLKNKKRFPASKAINDWIKKVYANTPEINTMSGDYEDVESSKILVERMMKLKTE